MVSAIGPAGAEDDPLDSVVAPSPPLLVAVLEAAALAEVVLPPTEPLQPARTSDAAIPAAAIPRTRFLMERLPLGREPAEKTARPPRDVRNIPC